MGNRTLPCLPQGREFMFNESTVHVIQRKEEKRWQGKEKKGKKRMGK